MRISVGEVRVQAHQPQQLLDPRPPLLTSSQPEIVQGLGDDVADRHPWVQRSERVLEDDLHLATHPPQPPPAQPRQVLPLEDHPARRHRLQSRDQPRKCRLPAPRLTDETERLPAPDVEADAGHRLHDRAPRRRVVLDDILDTNNGAIRGRLRHLRCRRRLPARHQIFAPDRMRFLLSAATSNATSLACAAARVSSDTVLISTPHRASWPGATSSSSGSSFKHLSTFNEHRGWNLHPGAIPTRAGGNPPTETRRPFAASPTPATPATRPH